MVNGAISMALRQFLAQLLWRLLDWLLSQLRPRLVQRQLLLPLGLEYKQALLLLARLRLRLLRLYQSRLVQQQLHRLQRYRFRVSGLHKRLRQSLPLPLCQRLPYQYRLQVALLTQLQQSLSPELKYTKAYNQSPAQAPCLSQGQSNGLKSRRPQRPTVSNPLPQQIGQHNQTLQQTGARQLKG